MTTLNIATLLGIATLAVYALYRYLLPKPLPGIPYNLEATKNLFGDAPNMGEEVGKTGEFGFWLAKQVERMQSPVCQIFILPFQKPWILLADYREAQDILFRRAHEFDKPQFLIDGLACLGDFHARYPTSPLFRARRQLKQDLTTPKFLNDYMGPFIYSHGLKLVHSLELKMDLANGRPFSASHDFDFLSLDVMLHYAFAENISESALILQIDLLSKMAKHEIAKGNIDDTVEFPKAPLSPFLVALQRHQGYWRGPQYLGLQSLVTGGGANKAATKNEQSGQVRSALEHILRRERMTAEKQGREPQYGRQSLADEIFADIIAGHHTTASVMCWGTKFLTSYPLAQSKLRAALYAAIPEAFAERRSPSFEEIRKAKVPYLEAVIEEHLRLAPFSMTRSATCDTVVLGHVIPKGSQITMVNAGPGYLSPAIPVSDEVRSESSRAAKPPGKWDERKDLMLFEPERWLVYGDDGSVEFNSSAGPQHDFGGGIRQCWGRRMAHMEVRTILTLIVWHFQLLEIPDELGGFGGIDGMSRQPKRTFVRLEKSAALG